MDSGHPRRGGLSGWSVRLVDRKACLALARDARHTQPRHRNDLALNFCGDCGTPLFSVPAARPNIRVIYAGALDDPSWVPVKLHIWADSALPWAIADDGIERVSGQPNMADYIGKV